MTQTDTIISEFTMPAPREVGKWIGIIVVTGLLYVLTPETVVQGLHRETDLVDTFVRTYSGPGKEPIWEALGFLWHVAVLGASLGYFGFRDEIRSPDRRTVVLAGGGLAVVVALSLVRFLVFATGLGGETVDRGGWLVDAAMNVAPYGQAYVFAGILIGAALVTADFSTSRGYRKFFFRSFLSVLTVTFWTMLGRDLAYAVTYSMASEEQFSVIDVLSGAFESAVSIASLSLWWALVALAGIALVRLAMDPPSRGDLRELFSNTVR